jgi:predicted DNA-binding antitoxin AbrB/MazE fold protein
MTIRTIYTEGVFVPQQPVSLREGTTVDIEVCETDDGDQYVQMTEENWPTTPEGIQKLIQRMDAAPKLEISDEDYKKIIEARRMQKEFELSRAAIEDEKIMKCLHNVI